MKPVEQRMGGQNETVRTQANKTTSIENFNEIVCVVSQYKGR